MTTVVDKRRSSLSQVVYDQTKTMILQRDLTPGQFINGAQLQALLGFGCTPVREVVLTLARDKLVHIHPRKGIEISRPTPKDIHNIFEIRSLLEPLILHQCSHQVDLQWAVDMRTLLLQYQDDKTGSAGQTAAPLIGLDNEFHLKLVDTLHNQYVSQLVRNLTEYLNLIRITAWYPSRYQVSNREHTDILNTILERRPEDTCRLSSEYVQLSYQEVVNTMIYCPFQCAKILVADSLWREFLSAPVSVKE